MSSPILVGRRVRLRPATPDDAPHLVRWASDADFAWLQWGRGPGRFDDATARAWIDRFAGAEDARLYVIEHEGRPIGFTNYRDHRPKPRSAEVGIGIGEKELWGKGLGRDALGTLVRHLVDGLGCHRVTLSVLAFNDRAIASYKALGFEVEGVERDAVMTDRGTFVDDVRMAYLAGRGRPAFDPRPVVLEGKHVRLEPLRMEHAPELFEAQSEDDIWTWLSEPMPRTVADTEAFIRRALDLQVRGEQLPWLTRRARDGKAVGTTRYLNIDRANRSVEIGWTMLSALGRRTPVNTEAKYLQLRHAFDDLGALRVWLKTDARNERSRRAIERIGATLEGVVRSQQVVRDGRVRDAAFYSIVDREWPEAKGHLERLLAR
ncbi:MAG TPA: GNAT family protein [Candidatus Limnocylindria bacterium]|nr:GNAT family protein [Candidatus Limnocylindria bacterium]